MQIAPYFPNWKAEQMREDTVVRVCPGGGGGAMIYDPPWIQTFSGRAVDLLAPKPEQIALVDIAHHLSRIARFNGATYGEQPWSVVQHSLLVESLIASDTNSPTLRLHALLHDAHETYIGDLISPLQIAFHMLLEDFSRYDPTANASVKANDQPPIAQLRTRFDAVIWIAFALDPPNSLEIEIIKAADTLALRIERDLLLTVCERKWSLMLPELPEKLPVLYTDEPPNEAKARFVNRVMELVKARHGV